MKKVAYLAPELPALSATFVYNEIFGLRERGYEILSFSVHPPQQSGWQEKRLADLAASTTVLYRYSLCGLTLALVSCLVSMPGNFLKAMATLIKDVIHLRPWTRTGTGQIYRFMAGCMFALRVKQEKCSHIHVHFAHVPTDIAMYGSILSGIPFSFTAHANDIFQRGYLIPEKVKRSAFVATISRFNKKYLVSQGAEERNIHIVRCGVNPEEFTPAPGHVERPATWRIGSLGRMVEKKGFETLLHAASLLKDQVNFQLVLAGSGPLEDRLKQLVASLALEDVVEFSGPVPHSEVPAWLVRLDLFVLACQRDSQGDMDGIPVVLMEAMVSGVPVISTRLSGIPELIEDGREGHLVPADNAQALAQAIRSLLESDTLRESVRANALDKVRREFSARGNLERLIDLVEAS